MTRPPTAARVDPDRARRYLENNAGDSRDPWRGWREVGHTVDGAVFVAPVGTPWRSQQMTAALREAGVQVAALREELRVRLTCGWTPPTKPRENR